jgi:hypothetical protein
MKIRGLGLLHNHHGLIKISALDALSRENKRIWNLSYEYILVNNLNNKHG